MNNQLDLFDYEDSFFAELDQLLLAIATELELPPNSLAVRKHLTKAGKISYRSLLISEFGYPDTGSISGNYVILKFRTAGQSFIINIRKRQFESVPKHDQLELLEQKAAKTAIPSLDITVSQNNGELLPYIRDNVIYCIRNYKSSVKFGCCHRNDDCSDAKKCLHPNKLYATGCMYRENLESGNIFYGKGREGL